MTSFLERRWSAYVRSSLINILVVGAGAIGCLVGGRLSLAGANVTLLGRPYLKEAVEQAGLHLTWPDGRHDVVNPQVIDSPAQMQGWSELDLLLLTVKSFATPAAMLPLADYLSPHTRLMSLQNGVGNEDFLAEAFPQNKIIAGSITLPVDVPDTGEIIVSKDKGGIALAPVSPGGMVDDVAVLLESAGFRVRQHHNYRALKWSKLMMNQISNASAAILAVPPAELLANPALFDMELAALRETLNVMRVADIKVVALPSYPIPVLALALLFLPNWLLRRILFPVMAGGRGNKLPSLLLDLQQGREKSEVAVLNTAVVNLADSLGVAVPVNRTLSQVLSDIVSGRRDWAQYQHQPTVLLNEIQAAIQSSKLNSVVKE